MKHPQEGLSPRALRLLAAAIVVLNGFFPAVWILLTSLKTEAELVSKPITWWPANPVLDNYVRAFSDQPLLRVNPFSNPWLLWAVLLTSGLQLALLYVPALSGFFGTAPLSGSELLLCIGVSLVFFVVLELDKLRVLWGHHRHSDTP